MFNGGRKWQEETCEVRADTETTHTKSQKRKERNGLIDATARKGKGKGEGKNELTQHRLEMGRENNVGRRLQEKKIIEDTKNGCERPNSKENGSPLTYSSLFLCFDSAEGCIATRDKVWGLSMSTRNSYPKKVPAEQKCIPPLLPFPSCFPISPFPTYQDIAINFPSPCHKKESNGWRGGGGLVAGNKISI